VTTHALVAAIKVGLHAGLKEPQFYVRHASAWDADIEGITIYTNPTVILTIEGLEASQVADKSNLFIAQWAEAKIYGALHTMREELLARIDMIDAAMPRRHGARKDRHDD